MADLRPHLRDPRFAVAYRTDFLIMASLTDELTAEDVDNFMASFSSRGQAGSLLPVARTLIGDDSVTAVFRQMWRTPRGRQSAEKIAFRQMPAGEHGRISIQLAAAEYFRQRAFGSNLSDQQEALVWDLCEEVLAAVLGSGQLAQSQMVQLALAWKGQTGWLGWASVAPTLEPSLRGPSAYVLAHRYLRIKKPDDAAMFLRTALEDAAEDALLAELAQTDLGLLEANLNGFRALASHRQATREEQGTQQISCGNCVSTTGGLGRRRSFLISFPPPACWTTESTTDRTGCSARQTSAEPQSPTRGL